VGTHDHTEPLSRLDEGAATATKKILILVAHLHEDRTRKQDRDHLQAMVGLHIASLLDRGKYHVRLHNEMWHGSYPTHSIELNEYAIVFLSGLQVDFDRMRQLSYFFRRAGSVVVAGGSICTLFAGFAKQFFDSVCAGGVEAVLDVMGDFEAGLLKPVYWSPQGNIRSYELDYQFMRENGITVPVHFVEASRGCNFKCDFCTIPAEKARHAVYKIDDIARNIDNSIKSSPRFSIRRLYPFVSFIDNNFSNNPTHLKEICRLLRADKRVKMWGALITQDVLRNHELIEIMANSKCRDIFTGIESIDVAFNKTHNKRQNVKGSSTLFADIEFAESLGMMIGYGYLFDPRISGIEQMKAELRIILQSDLLHHPYFVAFVAPLAGTKLFWQAAARGELLPNLRLRDLDGRCIAYRETVDDLAALSEFAGTIFGTPHIYCNRKKTVIRFFRHIWRYGRKNPVLSYLFFHNRTRLRRLGRNHSKAVKRNYIGGREILDPQYFDYPDDITQEDKLRYFDPITVTNEEGKPAEWLKRYRPSAL
jgi:pyruvate-formate lyase-activating enzyme